MRNYHDEHFFVTYTIKASTYDEAKLIADGIRVEQTIEFPVELLTDETIREKVLGQLVSLEAVEGEESCYEAKVAYAADTSSFEVSQWLNVVFGNSSLQPNIWVTNIEIGEALEAFFRGPRLGLAGIRETIGIEERRAMIQAVVKPMGSSVDTLAKMCRDYTLGGVDVIKDDHGITNQSYAPFKERVKACAQTVLENRVKTGHHTLYAANVSCDGPELLERAYYAKEAGATALMVAPGIVGFGWLHALATNEEIGLPIISHPAMLGGFALPGITGIADYLWLGLLPRLCGADMPIFVSYGGRFTFKASQCQRIQREILKPLGTIKAACPSPGGGVTGKRIPELLTIYGKDAMFLVGGDMFRRGPNLVENMKYFMNLVKA